MKKKNLITVLFHGILYSVILCLILFLLQHFQDSLPGFLSDLIAFIFQWGPWPYIVVIAFEAIVALTHIGLNNLDTNEIIKKDGVTDEWLLEDFKNAEKAPFNYRISEKYVYIINFNGVYVMRKSEIKSVSVQEVKNTKSRVTKVNGYARSTYHSSEYYIYTVIIKAEKKTYKHKTTDAETARKLKDYFVSNFKDNE